MEKMFVILVAVIGFGISANAQNKLGAYTEVQLKNGKLIYIEEKDNGIGPGKGWKRYLLNQINWPVSFESCATQHDVDYGTLGISKYDADMKLKRCAEDCYSGTVNDLAKQQGKTISAIVSALRLNGTVDKYANMKFADLVYELMTGSTGNDSYGTGQSMAQTTERYKREVEEALGYCPDTYSYYFILVADGTSSNRSTTQTTNDYSLGAALGNPEAQYNLGLQYLESKDYTQAISWFRKAAEKGHAGAQYSLGRRYETGEGVNQNDTEASYWFEKAAKQGFREAQYCLATNYQRGRGVTKDEAQAVFWHRKAATQGDVNSQFNLGVILSSDKFGCKDGDTALYWLEKCRYSVEIGKFKNAIDAIIEKLKSEGYSSFRAKP
jgi:TPR repeat protein